MKYFKSLLLLSIMIFCLCSFSQTTITEFIQYDVDLLSFKENQNSEIQILNYIEGLFESVKLNKIKDYDAEYNLNKMNFDFKEIDHSKTDSLFIQVFEYMTRINFPDPDEPGDIIDSVCTGIKVFDYNDVIKIRFIEKWDTNDKGNIIKTVVAFAPVVLTEVWKDEMSLFWVKSSEMPDLNFKGDITYRVKIKEKNDYDEFWYVNNILPPNRIKFVQPFIKKIEKGELKEYILDTLLPKHKIESIHFPKPSEIFISLEVKRNELNPFTILEHGICELTAERVVEIAFKEKWILKSKGFTKQISEYALVFEVFLITLPEPDEHYIYVLFWIKPE